MVVTTIRVGHLVMQWKLDEPEVNRVIFSVTGGAFLDLSHRQHRVRSFRHAQPETSHFMAHE